MLALVWVKLISRWLIAASIAPNCALPATPRKKKEKKKPSTMGGGHAEKCALLRKFSIVPFFCGGRGLDIKKLARIAASIPLESKPSVQ